MKRFVWVFLPVVAAISWIGCAVEPQDDYKVCAVDADCLQPQHCVAGSCTAEGDSAIDIADNVKWLEKLAAFRDVIVEPDRLVFTFDRPAELIDVRVGDLVVGMRGDAGYLRRVESLKTEGNELVLETSLAQIQEAVSGDWTRNSAGLEGEVTRYESDFGQLRVLRQSYRKPDGFGQLEQAETCLCGEGSSHDPGSYHEDCCNNPPAGDYQYEVKLTEHPAEGKIFEQTFAITCGGAGDNLNCTQGQCACEGGTCPSGYECVTTGCTQDDIDAGREAGICRRTGVSQASVTMGLKFVEPSAIRFDPTFDVSSKTESHWIFWRKLTHFHVVLGGDFQADMKVQAYADMGLSYEPPEVTVFEMSKNVWFGIGWFPVMLKIEFKFLAGFNIAINVGGSVTTGVKITANLAAGAQWHNETTADQGWNGTPTTKETFTPIWQSSFDKSWYEPEYEAHGTLTVNAWVKPLVGAKFYGVGPGPEFWLKPMLTYILHFLPKVCHEMFASIQLGLKLSLGIFEDLGLEGPTWVLYSNHPEVSGLFSGDPWYLFNTCDCKPRKKRVCYNDDKEVRWADDCDVVEEGPEGLIEDCDAAGKVCVDGQCVSDGMGDLRGKVIDALTREPIEGATIEIYKRDALVDPVLTSAADGTYQRDGLGVGTYTLVVNADGYLEARVSVNIFDGEVTEVTPLRKLPESCAGDGTASGLIVNAVNGEPVQAHLKFREGVDVKSGPVVGETDCAADGTYSISLPSGNYTAEISYQTWLTNWMDVIVCGPDEIPDQNGTISPPADGKWRVVLTWGETPQDLDLHLFTPSNDHIFYRSACRGSETEPPYAMLDWDDRNSFGPETITVTQLVGSGDYTFKVHNYSLANDAAETGTLSDSGARIRVYWPDGFTNRVFNVPGSVGLWWDAVKINTDGTVRAGAGAGSGVNPADYPDPNLCLPQ